MKQHYGENLALYIKDIFLDGQLLGKGVEVLWVLNSRYLQTILYNKWMTF